MYGNVLNFFEIANSKGFKIKCAIQLGKHHLNIDIFAFVTTPSKTQALRVENAQKLESLKSIFSKYIFFKIVNIQISLNKKYQQNQKVTMSTEVFIF